MNTAADFTATKRAGPTPNPYLAQSYNNQTHWNDAATDSTDFAVPRGHFEITPESLDMVPNDSVGLPSVSDSVDGQQITWWWAGYSLRKLRSDGDRLVEIARTEVPVRLRNYAPVSAARRVEQAEEVRNFLDAGDEPGLLGYMQAQPNRMLTAASDQAAAGAVYAVLTRENAFIGCNGRQVFRIDQVDPKDPASAMQPAHIVTLAETLFDNERVRNHTRHRHDTTFGMGMSFNGHLVINTFGGKVLTLNRQTLELIDVWNGTAADEMFMNSFATGPECGGGAVYVASNSTMYRLVVGPDGKIRDDEASGAWAAGYDRGTLMPAPKIGDGTGSTPTLMGFAPGEDQLVVITDGAQKMRLVAFWRNDIPAGWQQRPGTASPRIADQIRVEMGPGIDTVQSEQSVAIYGDDAFVVNNIRPEDTPMLSTESFFGNMVTGATRPGPLGAAAFRWDHAQHCWTQSWARADVSSISIVPMISGPSRMAIVEGYFADGWNDRCHIGLDIASGETVMTIRSGSDPRLNGMYTPIKCDPQGRIFYGMAFGLVRLDTTKMKRIGR
ncbi:MAG TPA: hypothetical protein PKB14_06435 [Rubrivivax sp.]|nr:hypothetical protein [Rubrivivax sp.]